MASESIKLLLKQGAALAGREVAAVRVVATCLHAVLDNFILDYGFVVRFVL